MGVKNPTELSPQQFLEQQLPQIPELQGAVVPDLFIKFAERLLPRLNLPQTSRDLLKAFSNMDVKAEKVAACLRANPYYEYQFMKMINSLSKREQQPSIEAAVILLGMINSRNLIASMQMLRSTLGTHPEWTKEGKLSYTPKDKLKFALKAEEAAGGNKGSYAETAFAAGLLFDYLAEATGELTDDSKRVLPYIDVVFAHGLKAAQLGVHLTRAIPDFSYNKYIFAACLVHDVGKIAMAILSPDYFKFLDEISKKNVPRQVRYFAEQKRYGVNHALLGSVICKYFKIFKAFDQAILFHHDPQNLRSGNKGLYQLASLVSIASNMAGQFKKLDKADDPILKTWKGHELQDFKLDAKFMIEATAKIV